MSPLEHSDDLLGLKRGSWVMACDTVRATNMREGGRILYAPGARFRVKSTIADGLWCLDENARTVCFERSDMGALEAIPARSEEE